jgi:hypothetical protein
LAWSRSVRTGRASACPDNHPMLEAGATQAGGHSTALPGTHLSLDPPMR